MTTRMTLLTVEEAAERLRVGRTRMFALIGSGAIRSVKIGRSRRIPSTELPRYVRELSAAADPDAA